MVPTATSSHQWSPCLPFRHWIKSSSSRRAAFTTFRSFFFFSHQRLGKANSLRAMCDLLSFFPPPSSLSVIVRTLQLKMRMLLQTTEYWRAFHACYCSVTVCTYVSRAYWEGHYPWVRAAPLSAEISFISALISSVMMPPDLRDLFKSLNLSYRAVNVKATAFIWKGTLSLRYDCSFYFFKNRFKVHLW